ncbi:cytochrome P450 [Embleya sp. AB8]|uniref:cytochrome P450 n=1 Tax=Embleya sp. AB8 TaxID=3156304 RepID=UPI003C758B5C
MLTTDGADHRRLRGLIAQAFSPRRVEALRPAVQATVDALLDRLAELPAEDGVVDLREHFCRRIPSQVICDLFGVPDRERARLLHALEILPATVEDPDLAAWTTQEIYTVLEDLVAVRKADPGADLTSTLLDAHDEDGDRLSHRELVCTLFLMIGAGTETVAAHLDHTIHALLTHPEQRVTALRDPDRWDDVFEESLRLQAPIMHMPLRFVTGDIALDEHTTLRAGDLLLPSFGAHGRAPEVHDRPEDFDLDRADKQHLAFGHGAHFCLGAHLARIESTIAVSALFGRFPQLTLAAGSAGLEPVPSFIVNDYRSLPVLLGPARRQQTGDNEPRPTRPSRAPGRAAPGGSESGRPRPVSLDHRRNDRPDRTDAPCPRPTPLQRRLVAAIHHQGQQHGRRHQREHDGERGPRGEGSVPQGGADGHHQRIVRDVQGI